MCMTCTASKTLIIYHVHVYNVHICKPVCSIILAQYMYMYMYVYKMNKY